ncbi:MAG: ornithine decarboxylase [Bacteroidia bacterium]
MTRRIKNKGFNQEYFNVAQLRSSTWQQLKKSALKLKNSGGNDEPDAERQVESSLKTLKILEQYWAFPGIEIIERLNHFYKKADYNALSRGVNEILRNLTSEVYRYSSKPMMTDHESRNDIESKDPEENLQQKYFEVLFVDDIDREGRENLKQEFKDLRSHKEDFTFDTVVTSSFQDALIALLFNRNIQAVVVRYGIPFRSKNSLSLLRPFINSIKGLDIDEEVQSDYGPILGKLVKRFRQELDVYYVTDTRVQDLQDDTLQGFNRIFYRTEDLQEIHLSIQQGIKARYHTPFFSALVDYSQKPTGVFHAMPISRGNSVFKSHWIRDFGEFYGRNLFLAETSATTGGLDSLLQPTGPLKKAQEMASNAYGAKNTFFVTNGTSTANKIVVQALAQPEDLVLIDRDCHKSHHYALVLSGAYPVYLDSYPVKEYSMYGAVPLEHIKNKLLALKKAGRLEKVRMLLLTNCTFDGVVYNTQKVMEEILTIKPDIIFLWDEAWFAFAAFTPVYKQRTAMYAARVLSEKYKSQAYRKAYENADDKSGMPDPDKVCLRVYATQSTHKTLSSLRQGSMIHIWDEEFKRKTEDSFLEAYKTHTSTSPNYQILGSLDIGRRQVQFEGYEMVEKSIETAMILRSKISTHPKLNKYFEVLTVQDLIPAQFRHSKITEYFNPKTGWFRMEEAWKNDEFVLDPTKINLHIGRTGVDGDTFKNKYLMDQFGIQINKTSRNTVLFMTNIGTTRSSVAYLLSVLLKISSQLDERFKAFSGEEKRLEEKKIHSLIEECPPLPDFSHFHHSFQALPGVPGGNLREAYFLSYDDENCRHIKLQHCQKALKEGREIVAASFVIPYPPGFPILVPGQVLSTGILEFFIKLDVKEIHGYRPEMGLRIFSDKVLNRKKTTTTAMMSPAANINNS